MARISKYQFDQDVTSDDFVIGSDGRTKRTRNYKLDDLSTFFGKQDQILGDKFAFIYDQASTSLSIGSGKCSFNNKSVTNTPFSGVTQIYLSKYNASGNNISDFLSASYNGDAILEIRNGGDTTNFGVFRMQSINSLPNDVIRINVDVISSNGTITGGETLTLSTVYASGDKTHVHTQVTAQSIWTVSHALNKFPSVTVVDDGGNVVIGDIYYLAQNELTITFNGSISGKAYLN